MSRDDDLAFAELHPRDRAIALTQIDFEKSNEEEQVSYWLSKLLSSDDQQLATEIASGHRLIRIGLSLLGALFGWLAIMGLFQYDGQSRVNLVYLLVVLVGLQISLASLTIIAMLPSSITQWLPGFSGFQQLLRWFSPGRLQKLFSRFMPTSEKEGIIQLLGRHQQIYARIGKWQVFSWSQLFGVAFNLAAMVSMFVLIATRDIAFGWSSTLDIAPTTILAVTNALSWPWHAWLPVAVPDLQLIEASHYFRLQTVAAKGISPQMLGQWWPFVMLCLAFYGFLTRLLLLIFCKVQLSSAYVQTLQHFPGRQALLTRLNSEYIETRASVHEDNTNTDVEGVFQVDRIKHQPISETLILIDWTGLELKSTQLLGEILKAGQLDMKVMFKAGANCKLEDDEQVIVSIGELAADTPIGIILKAWEPPLGELTDFITDLRKIGSRQRMIYLLPLSIQSQALVRVGNSDLEEWQRYTRQLSDPWIMVQALIPGTLV